MFASSIPAYLGRISFAVYLLHMPLIMSLAFWGLLAGRKMGFDYLGSVAVSFALFMVVLVVLAELFTRYVDGPSIKLADSWRRNFPDKGHLSLSRQFRKLLRWTRRPHERLSELRIGIELEITAEKLP